MKPALIVVGTSLGGLDALSVLLAGFPKDLSVPVAVVQHRGNDGSLGLVDLLQGHCLVAVSEPEDKEAFSAPHVYVAPADYHLLVERDAFALSTEAPVHYARPSIDVLFESAAQAYGPAALAVVLTGASRDGAQGAAKIKELGGLVVVQEPVTAESQVMPAAAIAATRVDRVLPLAEIAPFLVNLCTTMEP